MRLIDADNIEKAKFHPLPYTHITPTDADAESYERGWNDAIDAIVENEPTIEPEPHWIPVTERLPEEDGQYLITVKYKHVEGYEDIYAEHGEWTDGKWDMFCFGHCGQVDGITAWMPLPEPYKEGQDATREDE